MSDQKVDSNYESGAETTGKFLITFRDDAVSEGLASLKTTAGVTKLVDASDFRESAVDEAALTGPGAVFPTLGVAVVDLPDDTFGRMMLAADENSPILAIEPEPIFRAFQEAPVLSREYLRGYQEAVNHLCRSNGHMVAPDYEGSVDEPHLAPADVFLDDAVSTWGLKATGVMNSRYSGRGTKVAVLDTGFDLGHPDFRGRSIQSRSFVPGEQVQDGNRHGTHCIGTACGFKDNTGRRYGIAYESQIFVGKVLSNGGSGNGSWIIAGMEWAVTNECHVISMSLGNTIATPSVAYDTIGRRALDHGTLVVAAAGNHGPGTVGQPANSPTIMAVAAVDNRLQPPSFSSPSGPTPGANVDIAGPGVNVYSSVPTAMGRYGRLSGTSMATPHVSGIAALWAQAYRVRGWQLAQMLVSRARRLPIPTNRVGAGLVQAPR